MEDKKELSLELNQIVKLDKEDLKGKALIAAQPVVDGWVDSLDGLIIVKKAQLFLKELENVIKPLAEDRNVDKGQVTHGVAVTQKMNGVSYDYASCKDPVYDKLLLDQADITQQIKDREEFLKSLKKPMDIVDEEFAVHTIHPPIKSGKLGLSLTIK